MFLDRTNWSLALHSASGVADEELVRRFADSWDQAAFELQVRRHAFLDNVGWVDARCEPGVEPDSDHAAELVAVALEELFAGSRVPSSH